MSNLMLMKDCHTSQNMFCHLRAYRSSVMVPILKVVLGFCLGVRSSLSWCVGRGEPWYRYNTDFTLPVFIPLFSWCCLAEVVRFRDQRVCPQFWNVLCELCWTQKCAVPAATLFSWGKLRTLQFPLSIKKNFFFWQIKYCRCCRKLLLFLACVCSKIYSASNCQVCQSILGNHSRRVTRL